MTKYLNQILYKNTKFDSFDTIQLLKPYMYIKLSEPAQTQETSLDKTIVHPIIPNPIIPNPIIHGAVNHPTINHQAVNHQAVNHEAENHQAVNYPIINKFSKNNNIIHPKCTDTLFWCLYIAKYGYGDYLNIGQKYKNKEIEIKQQMIEIIKKTPVKLKSGPRKITNVAVQEIMAELMIDKKTTMKTFYAMCLLNQLNMCIIDTASKTYLTFITNDQDCIDGQDCKDDQANQANQSMHYIIYKSVSGFFSIDIEEKTTEQLTEITSSMVELENGDRPIKSISSYKVIDLEIMAQKLGISMDSQKIKKQDLYNEILVKCLW